IRCKNTVEKTPWRKNAVAKKRRGEKTPWRKNAVAKKLWLEATVAEQHGGVWRVYRRRETARRV
ncbi:MAG: hypothetical protein P8I59_05995, partial [Pseudomonadales bacterium]|nr:hypothetical protein [Pseudomonadales bacterium]